MNIIFDARYLRIGITGLGRYTYSLLDALLRSGLYDTLTVLLDSNVDYERENACRSIKTLVNGQRGCNLVCIDAPLFSTAHHLRVSAYVNESGCDIYFYPNFDLPYFVKRKARFVVHDLIPLMFKESITGGKIFLKRTYMKRTVAHSMKKAWVDCIAVSASTGKDLQKTFGGRYDHKIRVVRGAGCAGTYRCGSTPAPGSLPDSYLLYVGEKRPNKNVKKMIDTFVVLREEYGYTGRFLLAGNEKDYGLGLDGYIARFGFIDNLGSVSDLELDRLYGGMDALFFLTRYEGFGFPVLEAAGRNKRIISSNRGAVPEIAPPSALLLDPDLPESVLAREIHVYLDTPMEIDNTEHLAAFSWEKAVERIFLLDR